MNSEVREQCLYLSGDVSVQTLDTAAYRQWKQQCASDDIRAIDWQDVTRADSTALGLMIAALRARGQSSLQWRNLPESVRLLAELYEIEEWISE